MAKKKKENKMLSSFEEDCIWMSYRYCIGRHTIAAHCHAGDIANFAYNRLTDERMEFMSEDIAREIYDKLNWCHFINMGWYGNIPKEYFKPLDVIYEIFQKEDVNSYKKIKSIKSIVIDWDSSKKEFNHSIYYFNDNDKNKDYGRSFSDIYDLEVWQRLSNLFNKKNHKWCKLVDDTIVEYYEYWRHFMTQDGIVFEKVKSPVKNYHNFAITTYIPEENIKEDNVIV